MNPETGKLYESPEAAETEGVLVLVQGRREQVEKVAAAMQAAAEKRRKAGKLYESPEAAETEGERREDLVLVQGRREQVEKVAAAVRGAAEKRRKARRRAKASRKRNRG